MEVQVTENKRFKHLLSHKCCSVWLKVVKRESTVYRKPGEWGFIKRHAL